MICVRRFMSTTTAQLLSANEFRHPCSRLRTSTAAGPGDHAGGDSRGESGAFPATTRGPRTGVREGMAHPATWGSESDDRRGGWVGFAGHPAALSASRSSRTQPCSAVETLRGDVGAPVAGVERRYWASWSGGPWPQQSFRRGMLGMGLLDTKHYINQWLAIFLGFDRGGRSGRGTRCDSWRMQDTD